MSASVAIPNFIGGITEVNGLNRLWQTDQQADSERRKSEQVLQNENGEKLVEVVPGPISRERKNQGQRQADVDHPVEVHGTPDPSSPNGNANDRIVVASLRNDRAKGKYDSEATQDGQLVLSTIDEPKPTNETPPN